jgi:hypothetical protein
VVGKAAMIYKPGDIFFVMHHDNVLSRVIAWFMDSRFSHTGFVVEQSPEHIYTLETSDYCVGFSILEEYLSDPRCSIEVWRYPFSDDQARTILAEAIQLDDRVYGYLQLLSFAVKRILKRFGVHVPNFLRFGIVCDQVVYAGLRVSPITFFQGLEPLDYDSQDLIEMIQAQGFERIVSIERS